MGEVSVELLEQNVQHMSEDMRDMKKRVDRLESDQHDLKTNQQVTQNNLSSMTDSVNDLRVDLKELRKELNADKEERQKNEIRQLEEYKKSVSGTMWKIAGAIIIAMILFMLGLN